MSILSNRFLRKAIPAPGLTCIVLIKTVLRKFLSAAFVIYLLFLPLLLHAADDPRAILEKSFHACVNLQGGSFKMNFSKKTFNESDPVKGASGCQFSAAAGDSAFPFKFYLKLKNGDAILCTSNDLVQLKAADSMGVVYSRNSNQSIYQGAYQSEGLFPPYFQPGVIFSLDRLDQTTFIVRQGEDEMVMGKSCFTIRLIDLIRASLPDGQRQEKTFIIDKRTFLPLSYSEKSIMKLNNDSVYKENNYQLTEISVEVPHDSVFTMKCIPPHFTLRSIPGTVYHHHLKTGVAAPGFTGKLVGSDSLSLKAITGKKRMLFFFDRFSYPCLKALNAVQQFQNENNDVEVLLIGLDAGESELKGILTKRNLSLKAIENGEPIADKYYISALPAFFFIDEKGIIHKIQNGYGGEVNLRY